MEYIKTKKKKNKKKKNKQEIESKRVTFSNKVQVKEIYQCENEHSISKKDFLFAKCKLTYFLQSIVLPRLSSNSNKID